MKFYKIIGIISIVVFSFYLTDFVTELAINSNPLMQTIKNSSTNYDIESVDAIIEENTIIPGIKGKKVSIMESFLNMKDFGTFNTNYLIYDDIKPNISISDNKDKIIISGNKKKRNISILINNNKNIEAYLDKNNLKYTKLIKYLDNIYKDNVNIENDKKKFKDLDTLLNKKELNNKICILDYSNIEMCKKNKYYIVTPNIILKNSNIVGILNDINNGSIVYIDDNLNLNNFILFMNKIKNKDLKIVYLSEIIKE